MIGLDAPPTEVVSSIDRMVVEPHLGRVDTILEIGAGGGRFTEALLPRARHLIAADTSPTMLRLLKLRFRGQPKVSYILLDGRCLAGIPDNSIDGAFSYDVFVHLPPWHIYVYLEELRRVLRPAGRAVLHHANTLSPLGWQRFLGDVARVRSGEPAQARFAPMTPSLMSELARRAGLAVRASVTTLVQRDCITVLERMEPTLTADTP